MGRERENIQLVVVLWNLLMSAEDGQTVPADRKATMTQTAVATEGSGSLHA